MRLLRFQTKELAFLHIRLFSYYQKKQLSIEIIEHNDYWKFSITNVTRKVKQEYFENWAAGKWE